MTIQTTIQLQICYKQILNIMNHKVEKSYLEVGQGVDAELYYVRQGVINEYALKFVIPVLPRIDSLYFTWQNLGNSPLQYNIQIDVTDHEVIDLPHLNISKSGVVPTNMQVFRVSLPCTGFVTAEANVAISINIALVPNPVSLKIQRKKYCAQIESLVDHQTVDAVPIRTSSAKIFYYAVICGGVLVTTSIMCIAGIYIKNSKQNRSSDEPPANQSITSFLPTAIRNPTTSSSYNSFRRVPSYSLIEERPTSKDLQDRIAELTIQRCRVRLCNVVLEGTFSRAYQGSYTNEDGTEEEVFVKTVTGHASKVQISLLLQEGMFMYSLNHSNILSILGVSFQENSSPFLLYPYNDYTNMKVFLQKCKVCSEGVAHTLTTQEVVDMALQIIEAMHYIHKKHILHKDLAARNCVVDSRLKVQITDNALSRDLFPSDYHCLGDNENRPIKWLPLESLISKTFLTHSDVWSFGVLLWELTTLAQQPYVEIDPFEMSAYLKDGYRLPQPVNCPDELFAVMAYCWAMHPEDRPTFPQLKVCLKEFYTQLTRYV
ncbi:hypothetical protein FQR65_LT00755 [Abscondita terminalis]|nr:hypothetical protein FQR65_LT00755 [Abscondita terminalis]